MHSRVIHVVFAHPGAQAKSGSCVKREAQGSERKWMASCEVWILRQYKDIIINTNYNNLVTNTNLRVVSEDWYSAWI